MTTQTSNLRLILPVQGEFSGTWGDQVNAGLTNLVDTAIAGYTTVSVTTANQALTANNFTADQARTAILNLTTSTAANFAVYAPPAAKSYKVVNSSAFVATIYNSTVIGNTTAAGTGVAIPAGTAVDVLSNGTNFVAANSYLPALALGAPLPIASGGTGATTNAGTGFALKGANSDITSLASLSTPLSAAQGGTGQNSLASVTVGTASTANALNTANSYQVNSITVSSATAECDIYMSYSGQTAQTYLYKSSGTALGLWNQATPASLFSFDYSGNMNARGSITCNAITTTGNITMSGGAGTLNIQFNANSLVRGYVFADSTGIGFLSSGASWAAYVPYSTVDWYAVGNVTAYSDERVKTNWRDLPSDFLTKLAGVKMGVYDRTDVEMTQVGVSAQSLRPVLPNAVTENAEGRLSVAYGNAALASVIMLARKVEELEARLAALEV
ncbi:Intramolecular chaperone auto-processing domain containing protein [uncultured Caudovirales phage]|uniref:Intramolecular chaperone auto-processing domain containing protein n=1 Tax=uncultured Caudovirales phage TaxID=2100421 RepID=A0A6J7WND3_9CAUD|nr:Intramolecular chaperone auto-processing domain containing protein [uncultured Caudovirales phage]CAB5219539.1 Intramolecular chaperone auto-processing domain containing protein [uncultured Caudovirales phage]